MFPILAQAASGAAQAPAPSPLANPMVLMVLMFAVFYFLMIRPQQRREKERKEQIASMRAGTKVLFCGGMIGTVSEVRENTFLVEVAKGVVVEVARAAVERPMGDKPAAAPGGGGGADPQRRR